MSKYDHRLKRLEQLPGAGGKVEYWIVSDKKEIPNIEAGNVTGKTGSRFDPENKNIIIISSVPRPGDKIKKKKGAPRSKEISSEQPKEKEVRDLTSEELEDEISKLQKELKNEKNRN